MLPRVCFDVGGRTCCFRHMYVYLPQDAADVTDVDYGVFGIDLLLRFDRVWLDMKSMRLGVGALRSEDPDDGE